MVAAAPSYLDLQSDALAALQGTAALTIGGQRVPLDTQPGSFTLAVATAVALTLAAFYGRQDDVQDALTLATAQGADLDALVALVGVLRNQATTAQVPVLYARVTPTPSAVPIPVGNRVVANDATGQPTIAFDTVQGFGLDPGVAALIPANSQSAWALATAETVGASGNIGNNTIVASTQLAGVDAVSNPAASAPTAPTLAVVGTPGTTTATYEIVAHGYTGLSLPSESTAITTAPNTLSGANYVTLIWNQGSDPGSVPALSFDVLKLVGSAWETIGSTTMTSYQDTGQTPVPYALPEENTSNRGVGGTDIESDTALRARTPGALAARSTATSAAIVDAVSALPNVQSAICVDGGTPGTFSCTVVAVSYPLSPAQQAAVAQAIAVTKAAGAQATPAFVAPTLVDVTYTVAALASYVTPANLAAPIAAALAAYFGTLAPSVPVRYSAVIAVIMAVPGVSAVTSLVLSVHGGGTYTNADTPTTTGVLYSLGTITPTLGY